MNEETEILKLIAEKGGITLVSNREFYSSLSFKDGKWWQTEGDPMDQQDSTYQISESSALDAISSRVRSSMGTHAPDKEEITYPDILTWLQSNPLS